MDDIVLRKKYSSLKMDNNTVIKLKTLASSVVSKVIIAESIKKLEPHPDVNEIVSIPELDIPRNTTRSVNTSAILDDPILDDITPVLQPTQKFIAKSTQKIKDLFNWLFDYIPPKPKVVDEALESFKNVTKHLYKKRDTSFQLKESKSVLKKFTIQVSIRWKTLI